MKKIILIINFLVPALLCSQDTQDNKGNVWILGFLTDILKEQVQMNFNGDSLEVQPFIGTSSMADPSLSSISDQAGDLVLYTNGCQILNNSHTVIEGGDSLAIDFDPGLCELVGFAGTIDGTLLLPQPCDENKVNLITDETVVIDFTISTFNLYNTEIDITDKDNPVVIEKQAVILHDTLAPGNVYATRHVNGRDWWVCTMETVSNCFKCLLLNEQGFSEPVRSCTGPLWSFMMDSPIWGEDSGVGGFSPDGSTYVRFNSIVGLNVYDFNNENGLMEHRERILFDEDDFLGYVGASISPNSRFLYASAKHRLYQFDLWADDIRSSGKIVATHDTSVPGNPTFRISRIASDNKIYVVGLNSLIGFHVIHNPDLEGEACNVEQLGFRLPEGIAHLGGLPNNPWYGATPDNSPCDSLLSATTDPVKLIPLIDVYPNPTQNYLNISSPDDLHITRTELLDLQGTAHTLVHENTSQVRLDLSGYPAGLYFVSIHTEKGSVVKKVVVE